MSATVPLFFILLALFDTTITLPFTYPFSGTILSKDGEASQGSLLKHPDQADRVDCCEENVVSKHTK